MFQKILVPVDGSQRAEQALAVAARMARATSGTVVLLRVVTASIDFSWYAINSPTLMETTLRAEMEKAQEYLTKLAASSLLNGVQVVTEVIAGEPANTILAVAHTHGADLLVICSHGDTGFKRWMLGSVAQKIARHSSIPVLVLRESTGNLNNEHPEGTRSVRVMVALDGSPLAEASIAPAAYLSAALSAPLAGALHLMHIVQLPTGSAYDGLQDLFEIEQQKAIMQAKADIAATAQQVQEGELKKLHLSVTSSCLVAPDVAETLIETAELGEQSEGSMSRGNGCDIIAMATHGRSGLQRWVMGSVTERILNATRLPLLIVRPKQIKPHHEGKDAHAHDTKTDSPTNPSWVGIF